MSDSVIVTPGEVERGRQMAARIMIQRPESRERVEKAFGVEYCRRRYPEVYRGPLVVGWRRALEIVKGKF